MAKIHNPKSRPRRKSSDDLGAFTSDEHIQQGLEVLKGQGKPTCATCWHCEPATDGSGGTCYGVLPTAIMKDGQVHGAFPPVKLSWRCPNWKSQNNGKLSDLAKQYYGGKAY